MTSVELPSRRTFLAAAGVAGVAVAGLPVGARPAVGATAAPAASPSVAARRALAFLSAAVDASPAAAGAPALARSYADQLGLGALAFVADSAAAVCACLAAAHVSPSAATTATRLGDALVAVLEDAGGGAFVRQAYDVTDGTLAPATAPGLDAARTGDAARVGIALAHLSARTGSPAYLDGARRLGRWVAGPSGAGRTSVDGAGRPLVGGETVQEVEAAALFGLLASLDPMGGWPAARAAASGAVESATRPHGFLGASRDQGSPDTVAPVDQSALAYLVLGDKYSGGADRSLAVAAGSGARGRATRVSASAPSNAAAVFAGPDLAAVASMPGIDVYEPGVWTEGTARLAVSLRARGGTAGAAAADRLLAVLRSAQAQAGAGQTLGGAAVPTGSGIVAGWTVPDPDAGVDAFEVVHTGATAWFLLAQLGANPYALGGLDLAG
ncbi:MAG: hypothetical protein FWF90_15240 [Promicromonosporaceae bacterium]|nr:hypothetical protein [Promicromonosporaceae bacterium]